jgi:RecA-family ATPase
MNFKNYIVEFVETGVLPNRIRIGSYDLSKHSSDRFYKSDALPTKYLVEDYLIAGIAGTLTGRGGTGKSYLALDLAIRVAIAPDYPEIKWLGSFLINNGGVAVYVSAEEPENVLHQRITWLTRGVAKELNKSYEAVAASVVKRFFPINVWGNVNPLFEKSENGIVPTDEYWKLFHSFEDSKPALVVFDTKSRLSGTDENDNATAAKEVTHYEKISFATGATVLIIHHVNKASLSNSSNGYAAVRGAGAFQDNLRYGLSLQNEVSEEGEPLIRIVNTKQNYSNVHGDVFLKRTADGFQLAENPLKDAKKKQCDDDLQILINFLLNNKNLTRTEISNSICGTKKNPGLLTYHRARAALALGLSLEVLQSVNINDRDIIQVNDDVAISYDPMMDLSDVDTMKSSSKADASTSQTETEQDEGDFLKEDSAYPYKELKHEDSDSSNGIEL